MGEGSDYTGVPTKMVTTDCSLKIGIYNPATLFGIHVSSTPINLIYAAIPIATGQQCYLARMQSFKLLPDTVCTVAAKEIFPAKKEPPDHVSDSRRGNAETVPLYGAGASLAVSDNGGVPLRIEFEVRSRGNVVGKLVRTSHRRYISCNIMMDSARSKPIKISKNSCTYK
ncbi:hypothetical protein ACLOJK_040269 [Asimina triloba]